MTRFESGTGYITVTPTTVTIEHKRGTYHSRKVKEIRIKSISAVEMKKPGAIKAGYISFIFSGGKEASGRSIFDAVKNENTLMVGKKEYPKFLECKALIDRYIVEAQGSSGKSAPTSDADELSKWVALKESGAITADEYEAKKQRILGR